MNNQFDECYEFRGYKIILTRFDKITRIFTLTEDEFNEKKDLLNWMDFLVKTNQWIPFALYHDLFGINEYMYIGLKDIIDFKVQYMEIINKYKDVDLDLI